MKKEIKQIEFQIAPSQLAFLDLEMKWKIEAGDIKILIGSSSEDIRLNCQFKIISNQYIDGKYRKFYA